MKIFANRASALLYGFLINHKFQKPFLLPANVCPVVPLSFLKAGVDFEFVDIDESHAMNQYICLNKISTGNYAGVLFVHAYGRDYDVTDFYKNIKSYDSEICIIDDRCLCIPDTNKVLTSSCIDFQLFSTGYAKYVELSYGGFANVLKDIDLNRLGDAFYDKEVEINQQFYIKQCFNEKGRYSLSPDIPWLDCSNLKMTGKEYLALIEKKRLIVQENKELINSIYRENLPQSIQMGNEYENWRFCILVNNQQQLLEQIFKNNLFAGTNFPSVSYMFKGVHSQNAESESSRIINLFNDFRMNEEQAKRLCEIIVNNYE